MAEFLTKLDPDSDVDLYKKLWETIFECKLPTREKVEVKEICKGNKKLSEIQNPYTDVSELQIANNVYKAVYAVAYALHNSYGCPKKESGQKGANGCTNPTDNHQPWHVSGKIKLV